MASETSTDNVLTPAAVVSTFLKASSVAIVGASDDGSKPSGRTQRYLRKYGFAGTVYPVNPRRETVQGEPSYASISELPTTPDLAVIVLPVASVEQAIRECGDKGIRVAVIFASGYSEIGPDGAALQDSLARAAREAGVRILGPNCVGAVFAGNALTTTFMTGLDQDRFGLVDHHVAFVSQSGAMGAFILNMAQTAGLGLGRFFSTGNEADLGLAELIEGLVDEGSTSCVLAYVEGVRDGAGLERALDSARRAGVPVALMKVGRSERGAAAAASHTGALAGSDAVLDGVLRRHGVQRAHDVEHLLDLGTVFSAGRRAGGHRVSIVTLSGGAGVLMTDAADDLGLDVFGWDDEWQRTMADILPPFATVSNPIDTTGAIAADPTLLTRSLKVCVDNPDTDIAVLLLGNLETAEDELCRQIIEVSSATTKPVIAAWVGGSGRPRRILCEAGVPTFTDPVRAMQAASALADWSASVRSVAPLEETTVEVSAEVRTTLGTARSEGQRILDESASKALLASCGLPTTRDIAATSPDDAVAAAQSLGYPVVLKLLSDEIEHKSDIGGVKLGLVDDQQVRAAAEDVLQIAADHGLQDKAVVVQQSVSGSTELILGMSRDASFGPVTVVGMGGVFTEILADAQIRPAPVSVDEAATMIASLKGVPLLRGARGRAVVDERRLAEIVADFSSFTAAVSDDVESVDVNPLLIADDGIPIALDAVVTLRQDVTGG